MEQLIEAFGIDVKGIIVQIINFTILLGLLSYFLYNPILNLLREREEKIAQGLKDAEAAAGAKASAESEKRDILTAAHREAEDINARAKTSAEERADEIVGGASSKAASIVQDAEQKGEDIKAQAHKESESEIAKVAILAAEKVLRERTS